MSWLRNNSLRTSLKRRPSNSPPKECDPTACYDSFRKHWQQTNDIIEKTKSVSSCPLQDDVIAVASHLEHMVTLLLLELRASEAASSIKDHHQSQWPCLEYLLSENLLDRLFDWSVHTGKYGMALRLEQLKLYELLVSNSRHQLLVHEPFLRPLLKLLGSCATEYFPLEVEKRLVVLLNQLCVSLMQNIELLDLFFYASSDQGPAKFVIFTLLIPFIHREGGIGQQARDALLLCMSLSKKNKNIGSYIAEHSNVCPVLATGLSGLYSALPRKLFVESEDWHRLTPDDVNEIYELTMFMNSLEFCNAVVQVAHPIVKTQMLELLYQGFLVPVMGPALLQDSLGKSLERLDSPDEANTVEELIAATVYFDLFLRSITEPGLLYSFVRFLLEDKYDDQRILDSLIQRIYSRTKLCLVTLALFETLVDLNCEDVMLELVFHHLIPCTHVMLSQRRRVRDVDPYCRSSDKFLSLSPACCANLADQIISVSQSPSLPVLSQVHTSTVEQPPSLPVSCNLYGLRISESLYGNYHAYLCDARQKIRSCTVACSRWTYRYDGEDPPYDSRHCDINQSVAVKNIKFRKLSSQSPDDICGSGANLDIECCDNGKVSSSITVINKTGYINPEEESNTQVKQLKCEITGGNLDDTNNTVNHNSLTSIGESSGYESFALRGSAESTPENELFDDASSDHISSIAVQNVQLLTNSDKCALNKCESSSDVCELADMPVKEIPLRQDRFSVTRKFSKENIYFENFSSTPSIGPFLDALLRKLENMLNNSLYINLRLTGVISRLAVYPQPLLHSFLLNHSLVFQPSIRSLFQVLGSLKHKIDQYLSRHGNISEIVAVTQDFLISREDRLTNARKHALEASNPNNVYNRRSSLSTEPFSRGESKRKSFTSTISSVFRRAAGSPVIKESQLESTPNGAGYRYFKHISPTPEGREVHNVVMCAVILDEWLKELAAITQEQAVASISMDIDNPWFL